MLHATSIVRRGQLGPRAIADTITLDRQSRYRRRVVLNTDGGRELLLDLAGATHLADGDGLLLEGGGIVLVRAAAEDLLEIHAADAIALARIAWHLGNRHTPAQITGRAILIQPDHVLAEMVAGLGAHVHAVKRPFEPEGGAYGGHGPLHAAHHHGGHGPHHHPAHTHDHEHGPGSGHALRSKGSGDGACDMPDGIGPSRFSAAAVNTALPAKLLLWLSPAFPVGGFAFSHGLEWAAEKGWVKDRASLEAWLADLVTLGPLVNDLTLLAAAWRAVASGDEAALGEAVDLAVALQPSAERHLEAVTQGGAFIAQIEASWSCDAITHLKTLRSGDIAYCTAVAVAAAGHGIELGAVLTAYGLAAVSNLVSAAVRLGVVGQTDGQRTLATLVPTIEAAARRARTATLDDIGGACWRSDLASLQHETQYTRLFRS
jgi:urease accessory protein